MNPRPDTLFRAIFEVWGGREGAPRDLFPVWRRLFPETVALQARRLRSGGGGGGCGGEGGFTSNFPAWGSWRKLAIKCRRGGKTRRAWLVVQFKREGEGE